MIANRILTLFLGLALSCIGAQAQIGLPKVIGDNMVLQQGKEVAIWGTGTPGKKITVKFAGQTLKTTVAEDGAWEVKLSPMQASFEPRQMSISDGRSTVRLKDILVGEVWLASGQSNMEYRMDRLKNYVLQKRGEDVQKRIFEQGGDSRVRVLYVEKKVNTDTLPSSGWQKSSRETVAPISAPAYLFAIELSDSLNVPVGVLSSSWGGSSIEVWTPREEIMQYTEAHPESTNLRVRTSEFGSKFAHMIAPMIPYTIRGFLWYQGESNFQNHPDRFKSYYDKQKILIESWRKLWGDDTLPFYYVQIAPHYYSQRESVYNVTRDMLPEFWELQYRLMDVPYSGMAATTDLVDETGDIHPPYKHIVAHRLAVWALRDLYGYKSLEVKGPELQDVTVSDGRIVLTFSHAEGLTTSDGKSARHFQIYQEYGKILRPEPVISGDKVILEYAKGINVSEVRYAWDECAVTNLCNAAGLPAKPFRYILGCEPTGSDRDEWISQLDRIARPVLSNLSQGTLKKNMPFESLSDDPNRVKASYLEAFGRTVCGIGAWLSLGPDDSAEGKLRAEYIDMVRKAMANAVDPDSPDYLTFGRGVDQSLVDAAFLAEGIIRGGDWIWPQLDETTRQRLVTEWKRNRSVIPKESNWLLFASMVEAALLEYTGECDTQRLNYGVHRFLDDGWYKGDAFYGDGMEVHLDFYNSIVINPMLTDILEIMVKHGLRPQSDFDKQLTRERRHGAELERLISPEATFPVIGRSIVYRTGLFHGLAHCVFNGNLAPELSWGQVRNAMTSVMRRQFSSPDNFNGEWLSIGFAGHQINMSEAYINTGSVYMCTAFFLPLGLPADHPFWTEPAADWTSLKAWKGVDVGADHALRDSKL
jgi:hypothetical protein